MNASALDSLPALLDAAAVPADAESQMLVLEPIGPQSGLTSMLLDQPKLLIGWDVECSIQLPDAGVHSRHAVILRGQRHVVVKAWDPRTWLNGLPVTESPLAAGDLLKVGPVEFRVRTATADELLRDLPATGRIAARDEGSESARWLKLRRSRLAAVRGRLKVRRVELAREFERLRAERAAWEAERAAAAAAASNEAQAGPGQPDRVAQSWNLDADRMSRLFRQPARSAGNPAAAKSPAAPAPAAAPLAAIEDKGAESHAEVADSVADYMEHLLGRMRTRQNGGVTVDDPPPERSSRTSTIAESGALPVGSPQGPGSDAEAPPEGRSAARRRVRNVEEIRAGVNSLREIANLSARSAVASHTSRKLRQSVAVTFPLAIISFVLAGVLYLIGEGQAQLYSNAFGTVMLGVIVMIEFVHSVWKMKKHDMPRTRPDNEVRPDAPSADPAAVADRAAPPAAS